MPRAHIPSRALAPLLFAFCLAALAPVAPARASGNQIAQVGERPSRNDILTEHFRIVLDTTDPDTVARVAASAESAHARLAKAFGFRPKGRIDLVVTTGSDGWHGFTNVLENHITVSLGVPEELDYAGRSFVDALLLHELAHHFLGHRVESVPLGLGRAAGWAVLPMWFHEGLSEFYSSDWDPVNEVIARNALLRGKVTLDSLSTFYYADSIGRRLGYNLGFSMVNRIAAVRGEASLHKVLAEIRNKNLSLRSVFKRSFGASAGALFREWKEAETARYRELEEGRDGCDAARELVGGRDGLADGIALNPVFSPDGAHLYFASNRDLDYRSFALYSQDLATGRAAKLLGNIHPRFALSPDGRTAVFARRIERGARGHIHDLFAWDIAGRRLTRLTRGLRAKEPAFSPDGKRIVFTRADTLRQDLWIMEADGGSPRPLTRFRAGEAAYSPVFTPDGARVLFSFRAADGGSRIAELSGAELETVAMLAASNGPLLRPRLCTVCPGQNTVHCIAGDGAFLDIARILPDGTLERVSALRAGAVDFALSPDGATVAVSELCGRGVHILLFDAGHFKPRGAAPLLRTTRPAVTVEEPPAVETKVRTPYDGTPRMRYLIPWADTMGGNPLIGTRMKLSDPAAHNQVDLTTLWGTDGYRYRTLDMAFNGANPSVGVRLYDIADEFRPGQNRTFKGADATLAYAVNRHLTVAGTVFNRNITANSISPFYPFRHPAVGFGARRDAGIRSSVTHLKAERSVDADIRPMNLSWLSLSHTNTSAGLDSFFDYRVIQIAGARSFILSPRRDQITVRGKYGHSSGDFDFQFGGPGELRGYRSRLLVGPRVESLTLEYNGAPLPLRLVNPFVTLLKTYPTLFVDRGGAYRHRLDAKTTCGLELTSRILLMNKVSVSAIYGVARRVTDGGTEIYGQMVFPY